MATNFYFNNHLNSGEQLLIEDLVIESIRIHGIDVFYIPKVYSDLEYDPLYGEDDLGLFQESYSCEMYINTVDGFGGEGDFLGKFGLEIRDQLTMSVARYAFESNVGADANIPRPREGDLLYFPLNGGIFEVKFVEHEPVFYQMGALQFYELRLEKWEYAGERLQTGFEVLDALYTTKSLDIRDDVQLTIEGLTGASLHSQDGYRLTVESGTGEPDTLANIDTIAGSENNFMQTKAIEFIDFTDRDPFSEGGTF